MEQSVSLYRANKEYKLKRKTKRNLKMNLYLIFKPLTLIRKTLFTMKLMQRYIRLFFWNIKCKLSLILTIDHRLTLKNNRNYLNLFLLCMIKQSSVLLLKNLLKRIKQRSCLMNSKMKLQINQLSFLEMPSYLVKVQEASKIKWWMLLKSMVYQKHSLSPKEKQ